MKIIFMGTPDFSVPALNSLVEAGHEVIAVVTQPDKPKGRGKAVLMTPVKERALELDIPVYQPKKVREAEFIEVLKKLNPDAMVVVAFGQILPKEVLNIPKYGCINIHASLLPKYRGAAPIQWTIIDGETQTGVTTMFMDEGLDTGDMLDKVVIPIEKNETGGTLHDKLCEAGGKLIIETLQKIENGTVKRFPQNEDPEIKNTCYAKMLTKTLGDIDWSMSADAIERLIRGLNPWPSAYTGWNGKTMKLWSADSVSEDAFEQETKELDLSEKLTASDAGMIAAVSKQFIYVKTGNGYLKLFEVQLEGKKRMETEAFLRGYQVKPGDIFTHGSK